MKVDNLEENWAIFSKILSKTGRGEKISAFLEKHGQQILETPAKDRSDWITSQPGGLVYSSLLTLRHAKSIVSSSDLQVNSDSLVICCLLHDIGKIGEPGGLPYYRPQTSSWHVERGHVYVYEPSLQKMTHPHRSLYILQRAGIELSSDEFVAILTASGFGFDENKFYAGGETHLTTVLQSSIALTNVVTKRNI